MALIVEAGNDVCTLWHHSNETVDDLCGAQILREEAVLGPLTAFTADNQSESERHDGDGSPDSVFKGLRTKTLNVLSDAVSQWFQFLNHWLHLISNGSQFLLKIVELFHF